MTLDRLNLVTEILTLEEARRRLPRVREEVTRLMALTHAVRTLERRLAAARKEERPEAEVLEQRLAFTQLRWRQSVRRLNRLGAYVKDPAQGLVDFYTWWDGELAFLCWCYPERDIRHWHGLDEGFRGRKPVEA